MANEADIQAAISDLKSQEVPNFTQTAKNHNLQKTTLLRRFKGETVSTAEAHSRDQKLLTNSQETVLIDYIRKLQDRGLHPTPKSSKYCRRDRRTSDWKPLGQALFKTLRE